MACVDKMDPEVLSDILPYRRGFFGYTILHEAVSGGRPEILRYILERAGNVNINCRSCAAAYTPLHLAAASGNMECVKVLLGHGADIKCTDDYVRTAKQTAAMCAKKAVVKLLHGEGEQQLLPAGVLQSA